VEVKDYGEDCLGSLSIKDGDFSDHSLGVIEAMPASSRSGGPSFRYRVALVFSGDRWLFYPATPAVETMG
jgi:hypothetical protein